MTDGDASTDNAKRLTEEIIPEGSIAAFGQKIEKSIIRRPGVEPIEHEQISLAMVPVRREPHSIAETS